MLLHIPYCASGVNRRSYFALITLHHFDLGVYVTVNFFVPEFRRFRKKSGKEVLFAISDRYMLNTNGYLRSHNAPERASIPDRFRICGSHGVTTRQRPYATTRNQPRVLPPGHLCRCNLAYRKGCKGSSHFFKDTDKQFFSLFTPWSSRPSRTEHELFIY